MGLLTKYVVRLTQGPVGVHVGHAAVDEGHRLLALAVDAVVVAVDAVALQLEARAKRLRLRLVLLAQSRYCIGAGVFKQKKFDKKIRRPIIKIPFVTANDIGYKNTQFPKFCYFVLHS